MTIDPTSTPGKIRSPLSGLRRPRVIVWSIIGFLVVSLVALFWAPQFLLEHWLSNLKVDAATVRLALGNAAQVVLFSLGGLIALVGVGLSLSRHGLELENSQADRIKEQRRVSELDEQRHIDKERELRTRFTQAVALLSDPDKPTTRQAGVYALGALADDWINHGRLDERQVCIDVLCGYLRSRWNPQNDNADDERRIRAAAFGLIGAHFRSDTDRPSWDGAEFNFDGALVDFNVDFSSVMFGTSIMSFRNTTFSGGHVNFIGATFSGGHVNFDSATFSGGTVNFGGATFSGGIIDFDSATFSGGTVDFGHATFSGSHVIFDSATFSSSRVDFRHATFSSSRVNFIEATFSGGTVYFGHATFSGGTIDFDSATFSGGTVNFGHATFSGDDVNFGRATFSGGTIRLDGQDFINQPVVVPWNRAPSPRL